MPKQKELSLHTRSQIVTLRQQGWSFREIASHLKVNPSTCFYICKKYKIQGTVSNKRRSGRPTKLTNQLAEGIISEIEKNPAITSGELQQLLAEDSSPSDSSFRIYRKSLGFSASKGKPYEQLTEKQKEDRRKYCQLHLKDKFSNVLFTDEKPFELFKQHRKVWRRNNGPVVRKKTTKYPPKVQVWGGISKMGKTNLVLWRKRGTAAEYVERIQDPVKTFKQRVKGKAIRFQQDRDTTHTAKITHQWLDRTVGNWFETPAKSPDLNPIEMIWNTLESRVLNHNPENVEDLEKWINLEWSKIDQQLINRTIDHMICTIPKIIDTNGDYVD
jgi:transposase